MKRLFSIFFLLAFLTACTQNDFDQAPHQPDYTKPTYPPGDISKPVLPPSTIQ